MKKVLIALLAILLCFGTAFCFVACKDDEEESQENTKVHVDYNIAAMSTTMAYNTTLDILDNPSNYEGKVIRIKGAFSQGKISGGTKEHNFIDVYDSTSCCSSWVTFVWDGDMPSRGTTATVTGKIVVKKENGNPFPEVQAITVKF